jgi:hypothetical protein
MRNIMFHSLRSWLVVSAAFFTLVANLEAGPPLLCHPFEIGDAKSLPWAGGQDWNSPLTDYEIGNLVQDSIALLSSDAPVIVRMETLRRAAIYGTKDERVARELLLRLMARALNSDASGKSEALAWFDAGYLVETYKQAKWMFEKQASRLSKKDLTEGMNGYAWVTKAIQSGGDDAAMEFAASLMKGDWPNEHFQRAVAGAAEGSLLARNLVTHAGDQAKTFAELRAKYATTKN